MEGNSHIQHHNHALSGPYRRVGLYEASGAGGTAQNPSSQKEGVLVSRPRITGFFYTHGGLINSEYKQTKSGPLVSLGCDEDVRKNDWALSTTMRDHQTPRGGRGLFIIARAEIRKETSASRWMVGFILVALHLQESVVNNSPRLYISGRLS